MVFSPDRESDNSVTATRSNEQLFTDCSGGLAVNVALNIAVEVRERLYSSNQITSTISRRDV